MRLNKIFLILGLSFILIACATMPPTLKFRTLRISNEKPGNLVYAYEECASHLLGICMKKVLKKEFYDLNDKATRQQLIDMGFVAVVESTP